MTDPISLWRPFDYAKPLLRSRKKYLLMIGCNRLSKTDWLTSDFALCAMGRHPTFKTPKNCTLWISVAKNDKVDQVLAPKFKEKLRPGHWEYNGNKHIFYVKCGMNNWTEIVIKSEEAGDYEGSKVHRLSFDEQPDETIFSNALIRTIDTRGQVLVAATMWEHGITWLYDRFIIPVLEGKPEASNIELVGKDLPMESNPMLDKDEIAEARRSAILRSPEEAAVRFDGKYIPLTGLIPWSLEALKMARINQGEMIEAELTY